tara:strand:- start:474 stop:881 length:408 start_codon:yes stop_codon:yes gene_type:complete
MPHYESSGDFVVQDNNVVIKPITMDNNTYINNSKFMEFIDELATQFTETEFKENTFEERKIYEGSYETHFTNDAQNYYTQKYDEIETMANKIMGLYTDNEKPTHTEYYRICSKCEGENTHNIDDFGFCKHCLAHL